MCQFELKTIISEMLTDFPSVTLGLGEKSVNLNFALCSGYFNDDFYRFWPFTDAMV